MRRALVSRGRAALPLLHATSDAAVKTAAMAAATSRRNDGDAILVMGVIAATVGELGERTA